jgi:hypothetical protein
MRGSCARPLLQTAALALALGCSSPAGQAASRQQSPAAKPQGPAQAPPTGARGFEPIRFGEGNQAYQAELFPGTARDPAIAAPESVLGVPVGARPAHHAEVLRLWRTWSEESPRVVLEEHGLTYEGRELVHGVIGSPENIRRLSAIRADLAKLADPRGLEPAEEQRILASAPAVAWLGYSIHGDEMSGVDGGLALAWHLISGRGPEVEGLLEKVVVVIDPMMNPDGRERILSILEQSAGYVPNLDDASLQRGRWPYGRGNHYLFDMNRDWMPGIAPETRGRWKAVLSFHPQLFVDAHEMGGQDTFLFSPAREPLNRHLPAKSQRWNATFANEQAAAFDRHGWSYYTREWFESWYPGYSDAWGAFTGAIGILYEQARYAGQPLRRASGEVVTYREAVHHQAVSSLANLQTLAANREAILRDYIADRRANLEPQPERRDVFVLARGRHPARERYLLETLSGQGIEVRAASGGLVLTDAQDARLAVHESVELAGEAYVILPAQPMSTLARAYLEFDPRFGEAELLDERRELERKGQSKIYDVTAWCLAQALDLEAYWCRSAAPLDEGELPLAPPEEPAAGIRAPQTDAPPYAWVVDGTDDRSVRFAAAAMESGLAVQLADESFESAGRAFARGSLLVRRHENAADVAEKVAEAARDAGVEAFATPSARSPGAGPDLGGQHFHLLARSRIALATNTPVSTDAFGHVWHHIDRELRLPASLVDVQALGGYDLRPYNVIVIPPASGRLRSLLEPAAEDLKSWVRAGGTLIAMAGSATVLADEKLGLSSVRRRQDVLDQLDEYLFAARRERAAGEISIDSEAIWNPPLEPEAPAEPAKDKEKPKVDVDPDAKRHDEWLQLFAPQGVYLRGLVNTAEWITAGCGDEMPVYFDGSQVLLSRRPVRTPVRLAPAAELRIGGLLWPEARQRLAESAYLTVERLGRGQVILFAAQPGFRGYNAATARLLANAIVYGPGVGADQPLGW